MRFVPRVLVGILLGVLCGVAVAGGFLCLGPRQLLELRSWVLLTAIGAGILAGVFVALLQLRQADSDMARLLQRMPDIYVFPSFVFLLVSSIGTKVIWSPELPLLFKVVALAVVVCLGGYCLRVWSRRGPIRHLLPGVNLTNEQEEIILLHAVGALSASLFLRNRVGLPTGNVLLATPEQVEKIRLQPARQTGQLKFQIREHGPQQSISHIAAEMGLGQDVVERLLNYPNF